MGFLRPFEKAKPFQSATKRCTHSLEMSLQYSYKVCTTVEAKSMIETPAD